MNFNLNNQLILKRKLTISTMINSTLAVRMGKMNGRIFFCGVEGGDSKISLTAVKLTYSIIIVSENVSNKVQFLWNIVDSLTN